ncbi:MAG: triose-phosphate isomerase [Clostridia bacterium]|nr:triose-phosphate isomerase [Clostridia bacterium]
MADIIIAGNWKMHKTPEEALDLIIELMPLVKKASAKVIICPPSIDFLLVASALEDAEGNIALGAQNMHWLKEGAYTGEISAPMLQESDVTYVLCGHSERREYFNETDEIVNKKVLAAIENGLIPIFCVGETKETRNEGKALSWIKKQLLAGLADWDGKAQIVIAYEPIWAIGTGLTATADDAEDVNSFIRSTLKENWGEEAASVTSILYGGSVKPDNIKELMSCPNVDGALVGGASLKAKDFAAIVNYNI